MEFYGKSFPEAVQMLTGENGEGQAEATTAPPTAFHLPLHNRTADRAIQYLCESRGLNPKLVEAFLLSGDIYEDAKRHNVVFVGRDRNGTPRYAHVRGTADTFRQDITGSDKSYPFRYEGNGNKLFVFEAPIDLVSFICLYPQDWQSRSYLALGGVSGRRCGHEQSKRGAPDIPQSGRHCTGYRVRYRADWTPEQSRRNAKLLPGIGVYRHYGGSPQSAFYRQAEGQPHNEGAYP